jgi:hypothetical protein
MPEIACFITPHGLGHATRTIAVLEALQARRPDIRSRLFSTAPETLFAETLTNFQLFSQKVDLGLVQTSALALDIPATIGELDGQLPFPPALIARLTSLCRGCTLVLCDIAPLGILVARQAGVPSILLENFTWDWIYRSYLSRHPGFLRHINYLEEIYASAALRIQTEPLCLSARHDLLCEPIFRRTRADRHVLRGQLRAGRDKLVCITMGGITETPPPLQLFAERPDIRFVVTGQNSPGRPVDNVLFLDRQSGIYHPDLVAAADVVVGKAGYSTLAECIQAGVPMLAVARQDFPESAPLIAYLENRGAGISISPETYSRGSWLPELDRLIPAKPAEENGADRAALFLLNLVEEISGSNRPAPSR